MASPRPYFVVGFLRGDFGIAVAGQNGVRALRASGREAVEVPVDGPATAPVQTSAPIVLFQMNPLEIARHAITWRSRVSSTAHVACVPFWELPLLPRSWHPMLRTMDAILAPSRFIAEACIAAVPEVPVLYHPQGVFLPERARGDRDAWGISRTATVFAVTFDVGSDIARKNPLGAVEAFRRAFPGQEDVQLVVKMKPWPHEPAYVARARLLREAVSGDPRVRVVERALPYQEVLGLYANCDVLVALHRSEGLGLHLMEAMTLGKVVVATGWSGNADFMTTENSMPVGWRLVPVRTEQPDYLAEVNREGQVWAEPDVEGAARALRSLHEDAAMRRVLGDSAREDMARRRAEMSSGRVFAKMESGFAGLPPKQGLARGVRGSRRHLRHAWLRDHARWLLRRLGLASERR